MFKRIFIALTAFSLLYFPVMLLLARAGWWKSGISADSLFSLGMLSSLVWLFASLFFGLYMLLNRASRKAEADHMRLDRPYKVFTLLISGGLVVAILLMLKLSDRSALLPGANQPNNDKSNSATHPQSDTVQEQSENFYLLEFYKAAANIETEYNLNVSVVILNALTNGERPTRLNQTVFEKLMIAFTELTRRRNNVSLNQLMAYFNHGTKVSELHRLNQQFTYELPTMTTSEAENRRAKIEQLNNEVAANNSKLMDVLGPAISDYIYKAREIIDNKNRADRMGESDDNPIELDPAKSTPFEYNKRKDSSTERNLHKWIRLQTPIDLIESGRFINSGEIYLNYKDIELIWSKSHEDDLNFIEGNRVEIKVGEGWISNKRIGSIWIVGRIEGLEDPEGGSVLLLKDCHAIPPPGKLDTNR